MTLSCSHTYVRSLFAFAAQDPSELSFGDNEIMKITEKGENGWWTADYNGQKGLVPRNYLKEITADEPDFFEGVSNYKADGPGEMDLQPGCLVLVAQQHATGWWLGKNLTQKTKGWFPSNYVKVCLFCTCLRAEFVTTALHTLWSQNSRQTKTTRPAWAWVVNFHAVGWLDTVSNILATSITGLTEHTNHVTNEP